MQQIKTYLPDDETIIDLYWARDQEAIRLTDQKYRTYLMTVANNILHDLQDSEECLNDTYLGAWNSMPPKRPRVLKAFLSVIMRRQAMMYYRHHNRQKRGGESQPISLSDFSFVSEEPIRYTEQDSDVLSGVLDAFMAGLEGERRYIFISRYFYGHQIDQIAKKLGRSRSKINKELASLRSDLKQRLEEEGYSV